MARGDIIVVEQDLLKSEAFRSLSGTAKTVLFDFLMKRRIKTRKTHAGRKEIAILNNGEIRYSYAEAKARGLPSSSFMRALDQVINQGFIDVAWSGSGGKKGDVSLYGISERWRAYGTERFQPATRPKDKRQGRGFQVGNQLWKRSKNTNFGVKNGKPTIAKNGKPKGKVMPLNRQKRQIKKDTKSAETHVYAS